MSYQPPWKVEVFLDCQEGIVAFFSAREMSHLFTFHQVSAERYCPFFSTCFRMGGKTWCLCTSVASPCEGQGGIGCFGDTKPGSWSLPGAMLDASSAHVDLGGTYEIPDSEGDMP
ncbi:PREDICTED: butyrophilin-like protein 9 [Chaetura pelagica]|uniref:butyrophilin-like protein 9 n=1 Tax=Chaetura pelagica TaxID=8897 RepID=UPI000523F0D3|nr:PREDICTED: butyrophilin-like protein 9 [Chaetura pelagica]